MAARDQRVGMDGILIGTLTAADANATIDVYQHHIPTPLARQRMFELMILLDRVVGEKRYEKEKRDREAIQTASERKSRRVR